MLWRMGGVANGEGMGVGAWGLVKKPWSLAFTKPEGPCPNTVPTSGELPFAALPAIAP